jgi:trehalose 6-phosphate synthase/phosphatase
MHAAVTPGSWVEEKRTSLVWHYRQADPEFGEWKSRQLLSDLTTSLANQPLHVRQGKKIVEITPLQINKGEAVAQLLGEEPADVVLAVGDDATDEHMFQLEHPGMIAIKVGEGDSRAGYRIARPSRLRELLLAFLDRTEPSR